MCVCILQYPAQELAIKRVDAENYPELYFGLQASLCLSLTVNNCVTYTKLTFHTSDTKSSIEYALRMTGQRPLDCRCCICSC